MKWRAGSNGQQSVLLDPFGIEEEEQFILDERSTKTTTVLIALKREILTAGQVGKTSTLVAEIVKSQTMECI